MSELDEPPFDTDTRRAVTALERGGRIAGSGLRLRTILFELCSRNPIWAEAVADVSAMLNARGEVEVGLENATNEVDMRYEAQIAHLQMRY